MEIEKETDRHRKTQTADNQTEMYRKRLPTSQVEEICLKEKEMVVKSTNIVSNRDSIISTCLNNKFKF